MERKVIIVTGGAQGIGRAIVERFLGRGYAAVIADSDAEAGRETEAACRPGGRARFILTDVAEEAQVRATMAETIAAFGRIDVLVNNAAISRGGPMAELSLADWNRVLAVNLTGPFLCANHAAPHLRKTRGSIVNIASTRAFMSEPDTEAYAASKGGLHALTHALAASLGPDVRVNCVSPGWIETRPWAKQIARKEAVHTAADRAQHPVGRVGRPEDVAALVDFLASEESGFTTGANVMIDGGMTRKMIYV